MTTRVRSLIVWLRVALGSRSTHRVLVHVVGLDPHVRSISTQPCFGPKRIESRSNDVGDSLSLSLCLSLCILFLATIKVIRASLVLLRTICRGNDEVQTELFDHLSDFLEMQVAIPEMANLLTMVRA